MNLWKHETAARNHYCIHPPKFNTDRAPEKLYSIPKGPGLSSKHDFSGGQAVKLLDKIPSDKIFPAGMSIYEASCFE